MVLRTVLTLYQKYVDTSQLYRLQFLLVRYGCQKSQILRFLFYVIIKGPLRVQVI